MVSTAKVAIAAEFEERGDFQLICSRGLCNISRQLARWRVVLAAKGADHPQLRLGCVVGNAFGEDPNYLGILAGALIAAHDIVVQDGFDVPALRLGELGEMLAAKETLLFSRNRQENDRAGEMKFAENARAFKAHG